MITDNHLVRGLTLANIKAAFTTFDPELYIPLTFLSFQLNFSLAAYAPFGYHLVNLLLHILTSVLVGYAVFAIDKRKLPAIIAAILFAVHPINVETVAWAAGRKDALAAPFFLLAVLAYIKGEESNHPWRWITLGLLAFTLGLLSKVVVLTLPVTLVLIDWYQGKRFTKQTALRIAPFLGLSVIFYIIASIGKESNQHFFLEKIWMGALSIALHLGHIVFPYGFSVLYPYTQQIGLLTPDIFGAVLLVIFLIGGAWLLRKYTKLPLFALLWFVLLLLPSMTNIAKGHEELLDVYITSDRYSYLSSISIFLLAGVGFDLLKKWITRAGMAGWNIAANAMLCIIVGVLSLFSFFLALTWHDTFSLFTNVLAHYPNAHVAYTNIGTEYYKQGDMERALAYYEQALTVRTDATALYNVGLIQQQTGRKAEAEQSYRESIQSSPVDPSASIALALLLIERNAFGDAETVLRQAEEDMKFPSTHVYGLLGFLLEKKGQRTEAIDMYHKALELDPTNSDALEGLRALGAK